MKKIIIFSLALVMAITMVACGRRNEETENTPAQDDVTNNSENIVPDVIPDMDQNIPDPDIDSSMPEPSIDMDDNTDGTNNQNTATDPGIGNDNMDKNRK